MGLWRREARAAPEQVGFSRQSRAAALAAGRRGTQSCLPRSRRRRRHTVPAANRRRGPGPAAAATCRWAIVWTIHVLADFGAALQILDSYLHFTQLQSADHSMPAHE